MAVVKLKHGYGSDIRMPCIGLYKCPTPNKPKPHRHRRKIFLSLYKTIAEEMYNDMRKERRAIGTDTGPDISWKEFKTRYLIYSSAKNPNTHMRDVNALLKIERYKDIEKLKEITPEFLERVKISLKTSWNPQKKEDNTVSTINRDLRAIKAALRKAVDWKLLPPTTDFRSVKQFKEPKGRLRFFSEDEFADLYHSLTPFYRIVAMLGFYTGLRRGEIVSLKWQGGVDFRLNRIHIEPTADFTPKDHERRAIPMTPTLREFLMSLPRPSAFVLSDNGARYTAEHIGREFTRFCEELGLKNASVVTLRHSFGSHLAMKGKPARTIQRYMGHASLRTTEIYMHLSPQHLEESINDLPAISL